MTWLVSIWLALALVLSAGLKAWRADRAAGALSTYGVRGSARQTAALWLLIGCELSVALVLLAGLRWGALAAAGLFAGFALASAVGLLAGRGGRPCACFGGVSSLAWSTPARAAALALLAAGDRLGWFPPAPSGYDRWLTLGLSLVLLAVVALAVAVLALAREVGVLRMSAGAERGALEIEAEGPELGVAQPWAQAIALSPRALLRLAIFTSEGCPLCGQIQPVLEHVVADPLLAVASFDERLDAAVWAQASVPGSPYAVALSLDGVALAKGTFNGLAQLESVLATARRRERGLALAA